MRHILRIFFAFLLIIAIILSAVSCGRGQESNTNNDLDDSAKNEMCTISFENTDLKKQSVKKGSTIQQPTDPDKSGFIFAGWYNDANLTNKTTFPITVDEDIKLYANFYTYQEAFQNARENTIGDAIPGFEYEHTMDVSASYLGLAITGKNSGNAKYSTIGEVGFYDESVNAGALLFDGLDYKIRRGTTLQNISLDKNGKIKKYSTEQVTSNYKYDSSSLAKALFEYSDDRINSISSTDQKDIYKLNTTMSVSDVASLIANYINHPIIAKILCELPETDADTNIYVSFTDAKLDSYIYEFKVAVSNLQFNLKYTLKFSNIGTAKNIDAKKFENVALSSSEVKVIKDEVSVIVNNFKNCAASGYDFDVKTGVDFGATTGEINSTFKGSAYRKFQNNSIFFHNDIEIDSDYKNSNLYKDIDDVRIKLTKLSNGEVHIIEKKVLTDNTKKIVDFVDSDFTSFYLFDVLANSGDYSFAEKNTIESKTTYTLGITNNGAELLLTWLNNSLELDPLNNSEANACVYGNFTASSILVNNGTISVVVNNGKFESISITAEGNYTTSFEDSLEFSNPQNAKFELNMNILVNENGNTFVPFDTVKDAK